MIRTMATMITIKVCALTVILYYLIMNTNFQNHHPYPASAASPGDLKLLSWNATGIMSGGSYIGRTLEQLSVDVCGISEHWLYLNDLHFLESISASYKYAAVSDSDLERPSRRKVGKGGVAIFWKRTIDSRVSVLNIDDDHIIGIQFQISKDNFVYIIQVYLPSSNHAISHFDEYLLRLHDICSMYKDMGTLIIMGDINAHINGRNFVKPHDRRSTLFSNFLVTHNLIPVNTLDMCTGADSTFVSYSGEDTSMIDHILVPSEDVDLISECRILDDDALNVSNHRPVFCCIMCPHVEPTVPVLNINKSIQWRNVKPQQIENFRENLDIKCRNASLDVQCPKTLDNVDSLYTNICTIVSECSDIHLPHRSGFKQFLKPYWDETLKEMHKSMRVKRSVWISEGRPRGNGYDSYLQYKEAKRIFRQYHRKCAQMYLKTQNEEIDRAAEVNSEYFWKLVNKRKNSNSVTNIGSEIKFDSHTCRDPEEICNQWSYYFGSLYKAADEDSYDSANYRHVKSRVDTLKRQSIDRNTVPMITDSELKDTINDLSKGKSCGEDHIDNEHIIYSGPVFRKSLICLFNSMLLNSYIPNSMKRGIIITLFKGGNKRKDDPNNYRAITLTSAILKLFERILYHRIVASMERSLNPLQDGFQKNMGCNMTSFLLHESIYYADENKSKLYVCFLDAQKAFDKVWHEGLFIKLFEMGIDFYLWKIVINMHVNLFIY